MGLFDPEGIGAGTRCTLVPQKVTHLPFQSNHCCIFNNFTTLLHINIGIESV
ncbi:hypothetical protein ACQCVP_19725 [Rossellomorea vietnamensis]